MKKIILAILYCIFLVLFFSFYFYYENSDYLLIWFASLVINLGLIFVYRYINGNLLFRICIVFSVNTILAILLDAIGNNKLYQYQILHVLFSRLPIIMLIQIATGNWILPFLSKHNIKKK